MPSYHRGRPPLTLTPPEDRAAVAARLEALEATIGSQSRADNTRELLIVPPPQREMAAEVVADTLLRLRALEHAVRIQERLDP